MNTATSRVILPTDDDNAFPCAWHNNQFAPLEPPHDIRVSHAEQQDHQAPVSEPTVRLLTCFAIGYFGLLVAVIALAKIAVTGSL